MPNAERKSLRRNTSAPACLLAAALLMTPCFAPSAYAADMYVYGGGGGGGGAGDGGGHAGAAGNTTGMLRGGAGSTGANGSGGGGGGGSGAYIGDLFPNNSADGSAASGTTGGNGGSGVGTDASVGTKGGDASGTTGGDGGDGGAAAQTSNATSAGEIWVRGGSAGNGGQNGSGTGGKGGDGGGASLTLSAITVTGKVDIQSGLDGDKESFGSGGFTSFTANTLITSSIILFKTDGNLAFNVGKLDVGDSQTTLVMSKTAKGSSSTSAGRDGVYIGTASLGNGGLTVNRGGSTGDALIDTLELTGSGTFKDTYNPITLGKLALNGGTLNAANWSGIVDHAYGTTSDITLGAGGGTVNLGAGEDKELARKLTDSGGLTKTGAGVLTLSGTNTYTGDTTISAGTLRLTNASATGTGTVTVGASNILRAAPADALLKLAFDGNYTNNISGTGGVTADSGAGNTVTLSGTNAYTGMTTVRSGTMALGRGVSLASSSGLTLYGGASFDNTSGGHSLDGKTLSVEGSNGQSATYTGNLSAKNATLNFISPVNPSQPLLTVSGTADISNSAYNVGLAGGTRLTAGSQLTLLEVTGTGNTLTADNLTRGSGIVQIGSTVAHDITANTAIDPASGRLVVDVSQGHATEQAKALSEGFLGGMALSLQGADLVAGRGMESAVSAAGDAGADGTGFAGFGALSGGSLRYNTGSHVDMRSLSLLAGLAWGVDLAPGRLTLGAFFEYGNGSYNTHNSFSNAADVDGDGNTHYLGGGILARMDFAPTGPGRFYAEASGRMGNTHNEYDSSDLRDAAGRAADYDSDSPYYGLHFGAGYLWEITDKASLDLYGKYFWTRQQGASVDLSTGEDLSFKDADSSRLRFGGRFAYAVNEHVSPYVGAAWEHEFDGKARAATNGYDIDAPNLRGDTGIGEVGLSLTPSVDLPLTVDLGVQGYTGKREGVTGSVQVKFEF